MQGNSKGKVNVKSAEFIVSSPNVSKCPNIGKPEVAFIGRSNVGKSSLINMLTSRKKLAKISGTPGKTQLINHFLINNQWALVDLPGYGWAKVSKSQRTKFQSIIKEYLLKRTSLLCTFVLIDIRIAPQKIDIEFIKWMGMNNLAFCLVFTKADKLNNNKIKNSLDRFTAEMKQDWEELPDYHLTSSTSGLGRDELMKYINTIVAE